MNPIRILLAVDGSPYSDAAVDEVTRRPWPDGSLLKIINAVTLHVPVGPDPIISYVGYRQELMDAERKRGRAILERAVETVRAGKEGSKLQVTTEVVEGSPKHSIIIEAEDWGADLIILGSHGYGSVRRFLLGSVSQAVLTHAPCSVEIIRSQVRK